MQNKMVDCTEEYVFALSLVRDVASIIKDAFYRYFNSVGAETNVHNSQEAIIDIKI